MRVRLSVSAGAGGRRCTPARRGRLLVAATAALAAAAAGSLTAALPSAAATTPATTTAARPANAAAQSPAGRYIVRAVPGTLDGVVRLLAGRGIVPGRRIGIIDAVVAQLPPGAADLLRTDPAVASVTFDASVRLLTSSYDPGQDVNSLYNLGTITGARSWWSKYTGKGVDVAVVDSGVVPVAGLADTGKIVNGPDLTPESQDPSTRYLDTYGHGTHMAGIIAGHDAGVDASKKAASSTEFLGVAPDARIVSVKVADAHGTSDVSQVIAGIDWVVQHAHDPGRNIRVLNLSFGTNSAQPYTLDPLAYAAEVAWRSGIVVVVSAGNSGAADGRLTNPATDPFVIAVGAADLNGTASITDDTVPSFSSFGDGKRNPDLVAPGAHLQSLRVPGSYIDSQHGGSGGIDSRFFRGSGTSQAAAFVSGSVALILQKSPTLAPDQVKFLLMANATALPKANARGQGKGLLNLTKLANAKTPGAATQKGAPSTGLGSLDAARGDARLELDGVTLAGEKDIHGAPFNAAAVAAAEATGSSWAGGSWNGSSWAGSSWSGSSWSGSSWSGSSWSGSSWSGSSWATGVWTGSSWSGSSWSGSSWSGSSWSGKSWSGKSWADSSWS
jgi:serine protease AprX